MSWLSNLVYYVSSSVDTEILFVWSCISSFVHVKKRWRFCDLFDIPMALVCFYKIIGKPVLTESTECFQF